MLGYHTFMNANAAASRRQIDAIVYMASLASEPRAIDPILDKLRTVTATMPPDGVLTPGQQQSLASAQERLVTYLTEVEPVREFTKQSLYDRVEARFAGGLSLTSLRWMLFLTVFIALGIGAVLFVLPLNLPDRARFQMVGSTVFGILPAGAAIFFYSALRTFKPEMRRAYQLICLGMIVFGASMLDQPLLDYYRVRESPYGAFVIALPMLVAFVLVHIGMRRYFAVLNLSGKLYKVRALLQVLGVGAIIGIVVPHATIPHFPEVFFDLSAILLIDLGLFAIMMGLQLFGIARVGSRVYRSAQRALGMALTVAGGGALYIVLLRCLLGMARPDKPYALSVLTFIIAGSLFLRAGYSFNRAGRY